jgi:hypothetical protein
LYNSKGLLGVNEADSPNEYFEKIGDFANLLGIVLVDYQDYD